MSKEHGAMSPAEFVQRNPFLVAGAVGALAFVGVHVSVNGGNESASGAESTEATVATTLKANEACGTEANLAKERADTVYGSSEALFPTLKSGNDKEGNAQLLPVEKAKESVMTQLAEDDRALAAFTAFFIQPRASGKLPDAGTLQQVDKLATTYKNNEEVAKQDLTTACNVVRNFLEPTNQFTVVSGQAEQIVAQRDGQGHVTGIETQQINATDSLSGFEVGYLDDDNKLTESQKAIDAELKKLVFIDENGVITFAKWTGKESIKIDNNSNVTRKVSVVKNGTKITVKVKNGQVVPGSAKAAESSNDKSTTNSSTNNNQSGTSGGGGNVSKGPQPEKNSGPNTGTAKKGHTGPNKGKNDEAKTGTDNTPNGGGGGGGGSTTTSTGTGNGTPTNEAPVVPKTPPTETQTPPPVVVVPPKTPPTETQTPPPVVVVPPKTPPTETQTPPPAPVKANAPASDES